VVGAVSARRYFNYSLPADLALRVKDVINSIGGYRSVAEFITEAVRLHISRFSVKVPETEQRKREQRVRKQWNIPTNLPKVPCPECGSEKVHRSGYNLYSGGRVAVFYTCKLCGRRYRGQIVKPSEVQP
jgi:DNA-directed RNA polymerase subunit M/transcription elongation factor TFIIS